MLAALQQLGRTYGHALGKKLEETRDRPMSLGSLYKALHSLERQGYASGLWEEQSSGDYGRPRRRFYEITALGEQALGEFATKLRTTYQTLRPWAEGAHS